MKLSKVQGPKSKVQRDVRGVALVITLIMLSIITFMAVTFLVLSQRERSSVNGATDQKIARNASDAALARVSTELLTRIMLQTNFQDFDLMVSTNYINNNGFTDGQPPDPRNVNYDYETNRVPYAGGPVEWERNIANLLYNPRAPVFVETNAGTHASEFRFYRDENRNGRYDRNGSWPVVVNDLANNPAYLSTNASGQIITVATNAGGWVISNNFAGDPEWIGQLERPEELHSADNHFIARYAYLVVPAGKTLDLNYIHNHAKRAPIPSTADGFLRNLGVGTWEINLAGFLADLNTNAWWNPVPGYVYDTNLGVVSLGAAFTNANDILNYRYGTPNGYLNLNSARQLFPNNAAALANFNIDFYSDGPLMLGTTNNSPPDGVGNPWSGADNSNHMFSTQDIFSQLPPGFRTTLSNLGTSNDSYNAYTFYRMLAQLGTDSTPDQKKINVNFKNTDNSGNVIPGMETNLLGWTAMDFFTNAAAAMFRQMDMRDFNGNLVTITNIPIYEDPVVTGVTNLNYYTPAVHRILQLAANMFDATTNRFFNNIGPTNYPTVFRPVFSTLNGMVTIVGYREVTDLSPLAFPFQTVTNFLKLSPGLPLDVAVNLYGVPWVIGAKKGFPNFNEFSMENPLTVSRKIQFTNTSASVTGPPWITNQLFEFSITNTFGVEAWNSYTNAYGRPLELIVSNEMSITITNDTGFSLLTVNDLPFGNDLTFTGWPGWTRKKSDNSFIVPLVVSRVYTNGIYLKNSPFFVPLANTVWGVTFVPHLFMNLQFKLRYVLIDTAANRIIDFVNLTSTQPPVDISATLDLHGSEVQSISDPYSVWATNTTRLSGLALGVFNQIEMSKGGSGSFFNNPGQSSIFRNALLNSTSNHLQAPYTPSETIYQRISWQANDPLVHYLAPDITSTNGTLATHNGVSLDLATPATDNLTNVNYAYQPWGGRHLPPGGSPLQVNQAFDRNFQVKDPMVEQSDNWDFPTNKLANIGWLGRIHRGTPWQTVYLKSSSISADIWRSWANDNVLLTNGNNIMVDAPLTHPTADYGLFDLFTAAVNENASSGRLNINQTNLAAWSAVLSGVGVLTNSAGGVVGPSLISPAGVYDTNNPTPVAAIVQGINATRANTNSQKGSILVFPNGVFQHAGDVLATPQLSVASPFLNNVTNALNSINDTAGGISDEVMERIPQQIMSLLTLNQTPRFVIYSFGQTLHPADHSLVTGGAFNGLCTNYQITAESATRAVVRVEGTPDQSFTGGKVDSQGRSYPPHIVVEQFNVLGPD